MQPLVTHPCTPIIILILFFEIVHIIKCIGNNWLNLVDYEKTFVFPSFPDCVEGCSNYVSSSKSFSVSIPIKNLIVNTQENPSKYPRVCTATLEDLRKLNKSDIFNVLKKAPRLTSKACWSSKLERQNVKLALRIFHESTYRGLKAFNIDNEINKNNQTVEFLD